MQVVKRSGATEPVSFDKIVARIRSYVWGLDASLDPVSIAQKVIEGMYDGITTRELDTLCAETAATMATIHPDYGLLAGRLAVAILHEETKPSFMEVIDELYHYVDKKTGGNASLIADDVYEIVKANAAVLEAAIDYQRDFDFDYFGYKTLEKSYLLKVHGKIVERPQHLIMRVAVGVNKGDIDRVLKAYDLISKRYFTHASPTLFNAGTRRPQMSSCFLLAMNDDSLDGIYSTLTQAAMISKSGAGIGIHFHNVRGKGAYIKGTNGRSNGVVPMLRVFNETARYVDQGGGKRKGAFAMYIEPWHAEIFEILDLKKNHGKEEMRARDLFYGLWIPDLFMKRVKENSTWSLFSPDSAKGLSDVYGAEFEALYAQYEAEGKAVRTVKAQELWLAILQSQIETGTPYMLYKDAANSKSNQKNLGTIKSSNLCTEIIEYSDKDETAVCNLASIVLPRFLREDGTFDHQQLHDITYFVTTCLDRVIDQNLYPTEQTQRSNLRHRPVGMGVQGLADLFAMMKIPFESDAARQLNREIFETIYYAGLSASADIAAVNGAYETYQGSPVSQGILQHDMWGVTPTDRWDWAALRAKIAQHGVRNSLLVAPMPTASTSNIMGYNECFEPFTSNIYKRNTLSGEFMVVNKHLIRDLLAIGMWNKEMKDAIIAGDGSIQHIDAIPDAIRAIYKTAYEIKQKTIIDMAADRGAFIDQSMSLNLFMEDPNYAKLTAMHFYGWEKGLKTGMYYLRSKAAASAVKFTLDAATVAKAAAPTAAAVAAAGMTPEEQMACSLDNKDECLACGS